MVNCAEYAKPLFDQIIKELRNLKQDLVLDKGWENRQARADIEYQPQILVLHHTAADKTPVSTIRNGRSDLKGPLANFHIDRAGTITLISAGYTNNAGNNEPKALSDVLAGKMAAQYKPTKSDGNSSANRYSVGVECAAAGAMSEPQYKAAVALGRAFLLASKAIRRERTAGHIIGHKELTKRKPVDPAENMGVYRADVGTLAVPPPATAYYRVRASWDKPETQVGAFKVLENAKNQAKRSKMKVFSDTGEMLFDYTGQTQYDTLRIVHNNVLSARYASTPAAMKKTARWQKQIEWLIDQADINTIFTLTETWEEYRERLAKRLGERLGGKWLYYYNGTTYGAQAVYWRKETYGKYKIRGSAQYAPNATNGSLVVDLTAADGKVYTVGAFHPPTVSNSSETKNRTETARYLKLMGSGPRRYIGGDWNRKTRYADCLAAGYSLTELQDTYTSKGDQMIDWIGSNMRIANERIIWNAALSDHAIIVADIEK